jgi:protein-S-isoprenylcysteine O-methyltransferase Ste14
MALVSEFEKHGNFLFKYRGQFPIFLFFLAIPFVYLTEQMFLSEVFKETMFYIACGLSILGFLIRAYTIGTTPRGTSGRNTKEQVAEVLNSTGIYSLLRHPLYLGNYFMWIGIVFYSFSWYFVVIVSLMYWVYYERIMFAEERFLERKFGVKYMNWASSLPAFIPRFSNFKKSDISFSLKSVLRREYSGVLATVIGFVFMDICRNFFNQEEKLLTYDSIVLLGSSVLISLLLRTLKRKTNILKEEGRS